MRVHGAVARRLKVNRDASGILVEVLRADWPDVFDAEARPFAQTYYSITPAGLARDETVWHVHQLQEDRFAVANGDIVLALWDGRPESPTRGTLDLLPMGASMPDDHQHAVLIPRRVHHGFLVAGSRPATLMNFPTKLYNPRDEGRDAFAAVGACFHDGQPFTWTRVREMLAS
ncbi:MAG: dTDP-4-dehydrorhamnose 3,5-epimerase family protein [Actinobacteria bacterium]|nr:dTDP-4-dehydrorhamnose 3,5-epimerase family protein [Actinomycetota bacterium]